VGIETRAWDSPRIEQGFLFEPQTMAQAELRQAIERLDFAAASLKLEEFQRIWPVSELVWEPELIRVGSRLALEHLDLDSGYSAWEKLESRFESFGVSRSYASSMCRNFFSRLLAVNGALFEEPRTPGGRPLGDFFLLAEQPDNARRYYEKQIRRVGDGWELRLRLGNCDFRLGHARVARSNYHWGFVQPPNESPKLTVARPIHAASCMKRWVGDIGFAICTAPGFLDWERRLVAAITSA
jgi:hypothetical protein